MVVVYLHGKDVLGQVTIQYVLSSFAETNRAVRLISEKFNLEFRLSVDKSKYKVYNCADHSLDVRIIAESVKFLK